MTLVSPEGFCFSWLWHGCMLWHCGYTSWEGSWWTDVNSIPSIESSIYLDPVTAWCFFANDVSDSQLLLGICGWHFTLTGCPVVRSGSGLV